MKLTKKEKQLRIIQYLLFHPCSCGESAIECLDFHHINPKLKYKSISQLLKENTDWYIIENEIKKTVVKCSNCHRKITAYDNKWKKLIEDFPDIYEDYIIED